MCLPGVRPPTALGTTGANATSQQRLHSGNLATGTAALPRPGSLTAQGQRQQKKPSRSRIGAGRSANDTTSDAANSSGLPSALQARISQTISPTLHKMDKVRRRPAVAWKPGPEGPPLGLPVSLETATLTQLQGIDPRGACWYERALELARQQDFDKSRRVFQAIVMTYPNLCRAWVSWAQMEKKARGIQLKDYDSCRAVLQRGLQLNPKSSCLCQAWGLLELQKGNSKAAVWLLDRSAVYDPNCKPVQRWKLYRDARQIAFQKHHKDLQC